MPRAASGPAPLALDHRPPRDGNARSAVTGVAAAAAAAAAAATLSRATISRGTTPTSREAADPDAAVAPRVWKAFHARQAFLERERQYKRVVYVDPLLWGEALGGKLAAYMEELKKSDSTLSLAEVAAARGGGGGPDEPRRNSPLRARGHEPPAVVFCDDGEEYVADFFGAQGNFERVYHRRNGGLDARSREDGGRAGERERERAGFFADEVQETRRAKRARRDAAPGVPSDRGTAAAAASVNSGDFFADDVASALSALRKDGGQALDDDDSSERYVQRRDATRAAPAGGQGGVRRPICAESTKAYCTVPKRIALYYD